MYVGNVSFSTTYWNWWAHCLYIFTCMLNMIQRTQNKYKAKYICMCAFLNGCSLFYFIFWIMIIIVFHIRFIRSHRILTFEKFASSKQMWINWKFRCQIGCQSESNRQQLKKKCWLVATIYFDDRLIFSLDIPMLVTTEIVLLLANFKFCQLKQSIAIKCEIKFMLSKLTITCW